MRTLRIILILAGTSLLLNSCERSNPSGVADDGLPPAVPTNVRVYSAYDGEIELVWHANVEIDLKGYKIYRSTDSTNFSFTNFSNENYYLDDSLDYNTKYFYRLTAVDAQNNESEPSTVVSAVPKNIYNPFAPAFPGINARNWMGNISVYLSWNPGYETDIAGFYIYRSTAAGFTPDSASLVGFSPTAGYSDTLNLSLLVTYYYKIVAVDKGSLRSDPSSEVQDVILPMAEIVYPVGDVRSSYLTFKFIAVPVPSTYEITLQTNPYFGEIWTKDITTSVVNDTVSVDFDGDALYYNVNYYWRVITYTIDETNPNSISPLNNFVIQPE